MQGATTPNRGCREEIFSEAELNQLVQELSLSSRQTDIVRCLFAGYSDKQIANQMQIHIPTVRTHITRLFRKLDVDDREELILRIFGHFRTGCRGANCPRKQ
ncbi:MAG: LuxR C-terminal-related transcriptional regulator [Sedimentisphaerales bacterium]|jgi:DNA-binding NarL/FixJ family response regulator